MSKLVRQDDWTLGSNNVEDPSNLPTNRAGNRSVVEAVNVDIVPGGVIRGRIGYEKLVAFSSLAGYTANMKPALIHAVDEMVYFILGSKLYKHDTVNDDTNVAFAFSGDIRRAAATTYAGEVFICTDYEDIRLPVCTKTSPYQSRIWGIAPIVTPLAYTVTAAATGTGEYYAKLQAGVYSVAVVGGNQYGEEGGTYVINRIEVASGDYVDLTIPAYFSELGSDVDRHHIYISECNGSVLYRAFTVPAGVTAVQRIYDNETKGELFETQHFAPPLQNTHTIVSYKGYIIGAAGTTLWHTEPMRAYATNELTNFFQYPCGITNIVAVDGGVYVTADRTYWLTDIGTPQPTQRVISEIGAVRGSAIQTDTGAVWMTEYGQAFADDNGEVKFPNRGAYAPALTDEAAAGIIRHNGNEVIVTSPRQDTRPNALAAYGSFDTEVINP